MEFDAFIRQAERDAKVVDALYIARHMLATYHGLIVHSEREQLKMDFSRQIEQIDTALRLLGQTGRVHIKAHDREFLSEGRLTFDYRLILVSQEFSGHIAYA
jgi:hypothetical protein